MDKNKFEALLVLLIPQIIDLIVQEYKCDEILAVKNFYKSKVYELLDEEDTKMWHFSPLTLFNMYDEEQKYGTFVIPEEG